MKVQPAYIFALTRTLREFGRDPSALVSPDIDLDEDDFYELCGKALMIADDPAFALTFGTSLHLGSHGLLGNALMSCRTLRQAAEFLVQHNPVRAAQASVRFAFDQEGAVLSMTPGFEVAGAPNFLIESFFAAVVTGIGELVGGELAGCRIEFTFEPSMPEETYVRYLQMPVAFGRPANRLIGPREAVDMPLVAADNSVADMYVRQCGKMLRERDRPESCASEVRRVLLSNRGQVPNEYEIARRLNMSGRTLRRRLMCENTSFRDILDGVRNDFACAYLVETRLSIAEVGTILGFEDAANFRRAFRRWNGCSPQDFRGKAGAGQIIGPGQPVKPGDILEIGAFQ
jgi:AraC-like DNA-binding protein